MEKSSKILNTLKHPLPFHEIEFWNQRSKNLSSILHQLKDSKIKEMTHYLVMTESPYVDIFKQTLRAIIKGICFRFKKLFKN